MAGDEGNTEWDMVVFHTLSVWHDALCCAIDSLLSGMVAYWADKWMARSCDLGL